MRGILCDVYVSSGVPGKNKPPTVMIFCHFLKGFLYIFTANESFNEHRLYSCKLLFDSRKSELIEVSRQESCNIAHRVDTVVIRPDCFRFVVFCRNDDSIIKTFRVGVENLVLAKQLSLRSMPILIEFPSTNGDLYILKEYIIHTSPSRKPPEKIPFNIPWPCKLMTFVHGSFGSFICVMNETLGIVLLLLTLKNQTVQATSVDSDYFIPGVYVRIVAALKILKAEFKENKLSYSEVVCATTKRQIVHIHNGKILKAVNVAFKDEKIELQTFENCAGDIIVVAEACQSVYVINMSNATVSLLTLYKCKKIKTKIWTKTI